MANISINANFAQEDIQDIRMSAEDALEIILNDGTVVGYFDLSDTDGQYIIFNDGKALEVSSLMSELENAGTWNVLDSVAVETIAMPSNDVVEYIATEGALMHIDFDISEAIISLQDGTLNIDMNDQGSVIISGVNGLEGIQLASGQVVNLDILLDQGVQQEEIYADSADIAGQVSAVEPAAGGDIAEQVAAIEPAAGEGAAPGARGGFGFGSTFSSEQISPLNEIGPIGPTELQYGIEFSQDRVLPEDDVEERIPSPPEIEEGSDTAQEIPATPTTLSGTLPVFFDSDGFGSITPVIGGFNASGSLAASQLTSLGEQVLVNPSPTGYVGETASGRAVFEIVFDTQGGYSFVIYDGLDHADPNDPSDVIALEFDFLATDGAGDNATGTFVINVVDSVPTAADDAITMNPFTDTDADGNVVSGRNTGGADADSDDITSTVTDVDGSTIAGATTITGAFGTLEIDADGEFTYTLFNNWDQLAGVDYSVSATYDFDTFTYTYTDADGDSDTATLTFDGFVAALPPPTAEGSSVTVTEDQNAVTSTFITTSDDNSVFASSPNGDLVSVVYNGTSSTNNGGALLSNGSLVTISATATGLVGTDASGATVFDVVFTQNASGNFEYTYTQYAALDHEEGAASDDTMSIDFGITITDEFGLTVDSSVTAYVIDDNPAANDDAGSLADGQNSITGSVTANDVFSADQDNLVNGYTITGTYGTFTVDADGDYTYTLLSDWATTAGVDYTSTNTYDLDIFSYTLVDGDGDAVTAEVSFDKTVNKLPDPTATPTSVTVTEDAPLNAVNTIDDSSVVLASSPNGDIVSVVYKGTYTANVSTLTSNGSPVTVSAMTNGIVGKDASDNVIFDVVFTDNFGIFEYTYTQYAPLDHQEGGASDDQMTLTFDIVITDEFGLSVDSTITANVNDDAPVANDDSATLADNETVATGDVDTNDEFSADLDNTVTAQQQISGTYGTFTVLADGSYTYTLYSNWAATAGVDYSQGGTYALDSFDYTLTDGDGDADTATIDFSKIVNALDAPELTAEDNTLTEERNADPSDTGTISVSGANGGVASLALVDNSFAASGSLENGTLTYQGTAITTSLSGNTYTGMAGTVKVFELTLNPNTNSYSFTLFETLDHEIENVADDITLSFNVEVTDNFGLTATDTIDIKIVDDLPVANDDTNSLADGVNTVSGNVITNDDLSADDSNLIVADVIDGTYGQLVLNQDGSYTYTLSQGWDAGVNYLIGATLTDTFDYTLVDGDTDTDGATLTITKTVDAKDAPEIAADDNEVEEQRNTDPSTSGQVNVTGANGGIASLELVDNSFASSGSIALPLSYEGTQITTSLSGNTYTGMAGSVKVFELILNTNTGAYEFTLFETLDHLSPVDPADQDVITLSFDVKVTDALGLTATDTIDIDVIDDVPVAKNDSAALSDSQNTVSGNVMSNDTLSDDDDNTVEGAVLFGQYGELVIDGDGDYTYSLYHDWSNNLYIDYSQGATFTDTFTYLLKDGDGDADTATLTITKTVDAKNPPSADADDKVLKEDLPMGQSVTGLINVTGANGGVTSITPVANSFGFGGSTNTPLKSNGVDVVVSTTANGFVGMAGALTVFTLTIDTQASSYTFDLLETLDHLDPNNPVDEIDLSFDVLVNDSLDLTDTATINITVIDDAPIANDDSVTIDAATTNVATGNVVTSNDELSADLANKVTSVKFGGVDYDVPASGNLVIDGNNGQLIIDADGNYSYELDANAVSTQKIYTFSKDLPPGSKNGGEIQNVTTEYNEGTNEFSFSLVIDDPTNGKTSEGFTVAINNGPNPKGHGGEMALFYFDASGANPIVTAYAYNGANTQTSWNDGSAASGTQPADKIVSSLNANSPFTSITSTIDADGNHVFSFTMDASVIVDHIPTYGNPADWTGLTFDESIGIWLHPSADITSSYGQDGFLTSWGYGSKGWYDTSNQTTEYDIIHTDCVGDVFEYTLTDYDGDSDTALLSLKAFLPDFIVGDNVDDINTQTVDHVVGYENGVIAGANASDVLVGDIGGTTVIPPTPQDYNFVFVLDTSGSMGAKTGTSRLAKLIDAVESLTDDFVDYNNGAIRVHLVPFGSSTRGTATFDITDQASADALKAWLNDTMQKGGATNYEDGLQSAISWLSTPGSALGGDAETYTYFISDGAPNRYNTDTGTGSGSSAAIDHYTGVADGTDETAQLKALSTEVIGVGINLTSSSLARIDLIDSDGNSLNITDPNELTAALKDTNPITGLVSAGGDVIEGNDGDDLIFGDSMNTDTLAAAEAIAMDAGSGWAVFDALENGQGTTTNWNRDDTLEYIKNNAEELGTETVLGAGGTRSGGDDVINGGAGNDIIFGQEGDDIITGGLGDDSLYGGSGADTFLFESIADGRDSIKDFTLGEDQLDLSQLISITDPITQSIEDFVFANDNGNGGTVVSVDTAGSGDVNNATAVADLEGLDVELSDLISSLLIA